MDATVDLTPLGTARQRFLARLPEPRARQLGRSPPALLERLRPTAEGPEDLSAILPLAAELVRFAPGLTAAQQEAVELLAVAAWSAVLGGSSRLEVGTGRGSGALDAFFARYSVPGADREQVNALLADVAGDADSPARVLIGRPGEVAPLILDDGQLYLHRLHLGEQRLAAALLARIGGAGAHRAAEDMVEAALAEAEARTPVLRGAKLRLETEQRTAVLAGCRLPLVAITGGPGTGKTSLVVALLRTLFRLGLGSDSIALAAPTGKAANRMEEALRLQLGGVAAPSVEDQQLLEAGPRPQTLHRLLGWNPRDERFRHHANNPLSARVVIVDESSMIDVHLMDRLLRALGENTRLVLLGDADQLPSVEAGAVFRDLVAFGLSDAGRATWGGAVRLERSHRLDTGDPGGSRILTAARAINAGGVQGLLAEAEGSSAGSSLKLLRDPAALSWSGADLLEADPLAREAFLGRWFEERVRPEAEAAEAATHVFRREEGRVAQEEVPLLRRVFAHHETHRVLCLTRESPSTGAAFVNEFLHRRAQAHLGGGHSSSLLPGEPVMMVRNDYERQLFNGDQGVVIRAAAAGGTAQTFAAFPRGDAFELHAIDRDLVLCYAMTVHKSQGSEFSHVALFLPDHDLPLLTREVLYTALTRARRSVTLVGARERLLEGAGRGIERNSGIGERLTRAARR